MADSKIRTFNELRVDVFQAIKRAIMRKGVLPVPDPPTKSKSTVAKARPLDPGSTGEVKEGITAESAEVNQDSKPTADEEKKAVEGPEEIIELSQRTHDILFEANTVFPFTLFPDTVTLDREKLTIAERYFWKVAKITSVPISEILSCQANVGPFFGSIHLIFSFFADNERNIKFLWREDAEELQKMLHGYIIAHKREIDTTNVSKEDLKVMLKDIGQGATD